MLWSAGLPGLPGQENTYVSQQLLSLLAPLSAELDDTDACSTDKPPRTSWSSMDQNLLQLPSDNSSYGTPAIKTKDNKANK